MSQTPNRPSAAPPAPADKPGAKPTDKPAVKPTDKPAATKPAAASDKPADRPVTPVALPPAEAPVALPPAATASPASIDLERLPAAAEIEPGDPDAPAAAPGHVPPGSRSMRRRGSPERFALIYLDGSALVTRLGVVGCQGVWRVVEYPTSSAAARAYADTCSELGAEGFTDYA